jgi:hypothetical protein
MTIHTGFYIDSDEPPFDKLVLIKVWSDFMPEYKVIMPKDNLRSFVDFLNKYLENEVKR